MSQSNTSVIFLNHSLRQTDDLVVLAASLDTPRIMKHSSRGAGSDPMSRFEIGNRVQILAKTATDVGSRMGVITAIGTDQFRTYFTVHLASGAESVFDGSELEILPILYADMIFDSHISPVGLPDSASEHRMRFICKEYDIEVKLIGVDKDKNLSGRVLANVGTSELFLITLLLDSEPYATIATDPLGKFRLDQIPSGNATLEVLVPSYRIVATFV